MTHICLNCGKNFDSSAPRVFYCTPCRAMKGKERKLKHYFKTKDIPEYKERAKANAKIATPIRRGKTVLKGEKISEQTSSGGIMWQDRMPLPNFNRILSFCIPFDWALSKNARVNFGNGRHWVNQYTRDAEKVVQDYIEKKNIGWIQSKVYIDILVEKPNMRGDAVNFLDSIMDAIKKGIGVDDRWFSIGRLDWQISKVDPKIWVTIKQDTTKPLQACSHCGRLLTFDMFNKNKQTKQGIGRACSDCRSVRDFDKTQPRVEMTVEEND